MNKPRLLFVISALSGGPGAILTTLVENLDDTFSCSVIALSASRTGPPPKHLVDRTESIHVLAKKGKLGLNAYHSFSRLCEEAPTDVVISFDFASNIYSWWRLGRRGIPWLPSVHGLETVFARWRVLIERRAFKDATAIAVPSNAVKTKLVLHRVADENSIQVLPNGVPRPGIERETGWPADDDNIRLGYVAGFYSEIKGHRVAIESMQHLPPRYELLLIGDGRLRPEMEDYVRAVGMEGRIKFTGHLSREALLKSLSSLHAAMFTSLSESFGLAIVEAMSMGLPVVASDVGGIPDLIRNGENGYLVPANRPEAFAKAVEKLFADEQEYSVMSGHARETFEASFAQEHMVERYRKVLTKAASLR